MVLGKTFQATNETAGKDELQLNREQWKNLLPNDEIQALDCCFPAHTVSSYMEATVVSPFASSW